MPALTMAAAALLAAALTAMMAATSSQPSAAAAAPLPPLVAPAPVALPNCTSTCGDVQVPYPFGLGPPRCSWPGLNLTCSSAAPPRLLLGDGTLEVADISLRNTTVRVLRRGDIITNITSSSSSGTGSTTTSNATTTTTPFGGSFTGYYGGYTLSDRNELVVTGCNVVATLIGDLDDYSNIITGCASFCSSSNTTKADINQPGATGSSKYCSGLGCCQAQITMNYSRPQGVQVSWLRGGDDLQQDLLRLDPFVLVAEKGWFGQRPVVDQLVGPPGELQRSHAATIEVPLVLEWTVTNVAPIDDRFPGPDCSPAAAQRLCKSANSECTTDGNGGYSCQCQDGYDGNPYLDGGCQADIDECKMPPEVNGCFGDCTNTPGGFVCQCPPRTQGDYTQRGGCYRHDEVSRDATPHDPRERSAPTRCCNQEEAGRPKP
ncbi:hypothetical protein HU200_044165 [Digitaria exilis]|uniref:EGF-like domain-containing protein n=1 Tax=Digitaria exilis TaxID=1010633 RepID=A0A835B4T5_9POAL|nr:hypothetical protein HU200_044165 [Digitaria exilis]